MKGWDLDKLKERGASMGFDEAFTETLHERFGVAISKKLFDLCNLRRVLPPTGRPQINRTQFLAALQGLADAMDAHAERTNAAVDDKVTGLLDGILKEPEKVDLFFDILCK